MLKAASFTAAIGTALVASGCASTKVPEPTALVAIVDASAPTSDLLAGFVCGGVLTGPTTVVSAGHCFDASGPPMDAVVGAADLCRGGTINGDRRRITQIRREPESDYVVLTLSSPVPETPARYRPATSGTQVQEVGWGRASRFGAIPCQPGSKDGEVAARAQCIETERHMTQWAPAHEECVDPTGQSTAACSSDSGSPILLASNPMQFIGVVSWSTGCEGTDATVIAVPH